MRTDQAPVIVLFRRDLRLSDNPALAAAVRTGRPILPLYILDPHYEDRPVGAASLWWLDKSLSTLGRSLERIGARLILRRGPVEGELQRLIDETGADGVFLNRLFEPDAHQRDADLAHGLKAQGVECRGFNASLMARPGSVLTGQGQPYRVFTPFLRALLAHAMPPDDLLTPSHIQTPREPKSETLADWKLHPARPDWSKGFEGKPGEQGAFEALSTFISNGLADYADGRDRPGERFTSRLSPHLHWGEIGPWQVIAEVRRAAAAGQVPERQAEKFISEIGWREFSAHLLHHFPYLVGRALRPEFDTMPWRHAAKDLQAWKEGQTGYPFVDAGMRELWATGWMHNRVRMVVASFLIKHLMIDWRHGEAWFWDTLVDADLASNVQNWQWVAGSGADAAPYFRIFNPITQGEKFDPDGAYIRRWIPELAKLPDKWLHAPWTAPEAALSAAGIQLGRDYPRPIVAHPDARERALSAYKQLSSGTD